MRLDGVYPALPFAFAAAQTAIVKVGAAGADFVLWRNARYLSDKADDRCPVGIVHR